jgi:hypothetical protein
MSLPFILYISGIQPGVRVPPGVRKDTLRFSFLSFKTYHLIHYFASNLLDYTICITCITYQQLWGYKVEEKLYLGVREQKRLNTTALHDMSMEPWWNDTYRGKLKNSQRKICPSATLSITNPIWTDPGANLGLCGQRLVTNHLSHSMAFQFHTPGSTRPYLSSHS